MVLTQDDTVCKGVEWVSFFTSTFAPCSIKSLTDSALFTEDAICKGVERVLSRESTSAPCLINKRIVSAFALGFASHGHTVMFWSFRFASALRRDMNDKFQHSPKTMQGGVGSCGSNRVR